LRHPPSQAAANRRWVAQAVDEMERKEGSNSFLKKRTKKLLFFARGSAIRQR
jgi:hypothetical protein